MLNFFGLSRQALENRIVLQGKAHVGKEKVRAIQVFEAMYKGKAASENLFEGINKDTVRHLASQCAFDLPLAVESAHASSFDGSVKFIFRAISDGALIESVLIPERGRLTQCLSTQVGCAQACRFCQTGRMGLTRNLTTAEIVGQVLLAERWRRMNANAPSPHDGRTETSGVASYERIHNLVFMGMGEPLDNLDALLESLQILTDNKGLNFSPNKITVSTVGLLPQLQRLLDASQACVALSLHSPFHAERSKVMPVNERSPMADVLETLRAHSGAYGRKFMIQYTLIRNVNDTPRHAQGLIDALAGIPVKVNLIPLNEHDGAAFRRPDLASVHAFQTALKAAGLVATVRISKGRDIQAACGQLIKEERQRTMRAAVLSPTL